MVEKVNEVVTQVVSVKSSDNNADSIAANSPSNKNSPNNSKVLAFQFFEAYYTKLSDHPDDIGTFYGDDSSFVLGDVEETGRENIQRAIEKMNFGACKSRFYSVKAAPEMGDNCKVFQVCGELTLRGHAVPRRFCQTIVLSCVPPNVLYVKSNIFQWLDVAFPMSSSEKVYFISAPTTIPQQQPPPVSITPVENGTCNKINKCIEKDVIVTTNVEPTLINGGGGGTLTNGGNNHQSPKQNTAANFVNLPQSNDLVLAPPPGLEKANEQQILPLNQVNKSSPLPPTFPINETLPPTNKEAEVEREHFPVQSTDSTTKIITTTTPSPTLNTTGTCDDQKSKRHSPIKSQQTQHQQQSQKVKSDQPKSWNKVVSDGQNKMMMMTTSATNIQQSNIITTNTTTTTVPLKTSIAVKKDIGSVNQNNQKQQQRQTPPQKQQQQQLVSAENNTVWSNNNNSNNNNVVTAGGGGVGQVQGQQQQQPKRSSSLGDDITGKKQQQMSQSTTNNNNFVAPRKEWSHRIYFNNLVKPGRFVDFKAGQKELMKEIMAITAGVEFVGIKPISLRKEYKHAFGFIDFTTGQDVQKVYNAATKKVVGDKKGGGDNNKNNSGGNILQLKVSIPTFEFNGYITLTSDKTNNLAHGNNNNNNEKNNNNNNNR